MTTFLRVLEETENKEAALLNAIQGRICHTSSRYELEPHLLNTINKSPFAYWVSKNIRKLFCKLPKLEGDGRTGKVGLQTSEDFRFVRLWWETSEAQFRNRWFPFAKGGKYSPYYDDIYLLVNWENTGSEIKNRINHKTGLPYSNVWQLVATAPNFFFRPGLTWPRRTKSGLSMRPLNKGSIFADKGPGFFILEDNQDSLCSFMSISMSKIFVYLIKVFLAAGDAKKGGAANSYELGVIQSVPYQKPGPTESDRLASLGKKLWANKCNNFLTKENSHIFLGPALLQVSGCDLAKRTEAYRANLEVLASEYSQAQEEIDSICFDLYEISSEDRYAVNKSFSYQNTHEEDYEGNSQNCNDEDEAGFEESLGAIDSHLELTLGFMGWAVGVAFGRFDLRIVGKTFDQSYLPEPFDPIPAFCPAMLKTGTLDLSEYPISIPVDGILVDDQGHPWDDLVDRLQKVVNFSFSPYGDRWWQEICLVLNPQGGDVRQWMRRDFFQYHLSNYSVSRRKAPLYWPITTGCKGYTVWLYSQRVTQDTLYRVVELVRLRKRDAELELMRLEEPSGADERRARNDLEMLVTELKELLVELERIQPLFHPNLDDGTVLVLAPLHRLFKAYPVWQQELADRWKDLVRGEYDWSSQAMRLWPDRVVRKCQTDRSLAIAHGLDEFFWQSVPSEKAVPRPVSEDDIQKVIAEHTKPAIQYALQSLLDAPPQTRGGARRPAPARVPRGSAARLSTPKTASAEKKRSSSADLQDLRRQVLAFLQGQSGQVGKMVILDGTGVSANQWSRVIDALIEQGLVEKVGEKRGAGYRVTGKPDAGGSS